MESYPSTPHHSLSNELRTLINQRNMLSADSKAKGKYAPNYLPSYTVA